MGAGMALLLESLHPGTFAAIYAYEPPITTARSVARVLARCAPCLGPHMALPCVQTEKHLLSFAGNFKPSPHTHTPRGTHIHVCSQGGRGGSARRTRARRRPQSDGAQAQGRLALGPGG